MSQVEEAWKTGDSTKDKIYWGERGELNLM